MSSIAEDINKIYNKLEDDLSKRVFDARLTYAFKRESSPFPHLLPKTKHPFYQKVVGCISAEDITMDETIIIYGAGELGQGNRDMFHQFFPPCTILFCDTNYEQLKQNEKINQNLISPQELLENYQNNKVVISIGNPEICQEIYDFLTENNVNQIYSGLYYEENQYFDEFIPTDSNEIFVDAGVLSGETTLEFAKKWNNAYEKIYLFEADQDLEQNIRQNIKELPNTELHMKGLWHQDETLFFHQMDCGSGHFSENGSVKMDVTSLDKVLDGEKVTFIKMDIEGAELNALKGAKETIQKYKPKLSICVYHKPEDIVEIPQYILSLVPEYKLYLRQYSSWSTETVLYAIP